MKKVVLFFCLLLAAALMLWLGVTLTGDGGSGFGI